MISFQIWESVPFFEPQLIVWLSFVEPVKGGWVQNMERGAAQNSGRLFSHLDLVPFPFLQSTLVFFNPSGYIYSILFGI
jgi:hypothetical protein